MKKFSLLLVLALLASCGLKYTPAVGTSSISSIDFTKDLKKEERQCAYGLLWFPPFPGSDVSVVSIARDAGFKKVVLTDNQTDFFLLFNRTCTVVYGE